MLVNFNRTTRLHLRRNNLLLAIACLAIGLSERPAAAQSAYGIYYHNPRTGFSYSQSYSFSPRHYSGGFHYSRGNRSFGSYNAYVIPSSRFRYAPQPRTRWQPYSSRGRRW